MKLNIFQKIKICIEEISKAIRNCFNEHLLTVIVIALIHQYCSDKEIRQKQLEIANRQQVIEYHVSEIKDIHKEMLLKQKQ